MMDDDGNSCFTSFGMKTWNLLEELLFLIDVSCPAVLGIIVKLLVYLKEIVEHTTSAPLFRLFLFHATATSFILRSVQRNNGALSQNANRSIVGRSCRPKQCLLVNQ